jgi:hypothetical protein
VRRGTTGVLELIHAQVFAVEGVHKVVAERSSETGKSCRLSVATTTTLEGDGVASQAEYGLHHALAKPACHAGLRKRVGEVEGIYFRHVGRGRIRHRMRHGEAKVDLLREARAFSGSFVVDSVRKEQLSDCFFGSAIEERGVIG